MPLGPGKYDHLCTYVREQAKADAAIVIVVAGEEGPGFSVQVTQPSAAVGHPRVIAAMLRDIANQMERAFEVDG